MDDQLKEIIENFMQNNIDMVVDLNKKNIEFTLLISSKDYNAFASTTTGADLIAQLHNLIEILEDRKNALH